MCHQSVDRTTGWDKVAAAACAVSGREGANGRRKYLAGTRRGRSADKQEGRQSFPVGGRGAHQPAYRHHAPPGATTSRSQPLRRDSAAAKPQRQTRRRRTTDDYRNTTATGTTHNQRRTSASTPGPVAAGGKRIFFVLVPSLFQPGSPGEVVLEAFVSDQRQRYQATS